MASMVAAAAIRITFTETDSFYRIDIVPVLRKGTRLTAGYGAIAYSPS
jgi:hypothetical protein